MFTVPQPLCWTTLSEALYAPPPMIQVWSPAASFLTEMASSHTVLLSTHAAGKGIGAPTILKPNEFQSTRAVAMYPLCLVFSNDAVLKRSALLQEKHSVSRTWVESQSL